MYYNEYEYDDDGDGDIYANQLISIGKQRVLQCLEELYYEEERPGPIKFSSLERRFYDTYGETLLLKKFFKSSNIEAIFATHFGDVAVLQWAEGEGGECEYLIAIKEPEQDQSFSSNDEIAAHGFKNNNKEKYTGGWSSLDSIDEPFTYPPAKPSGDAFSFLKKPKKRNRTKRKRLTLEEATQNMIAHSNQPEPEGAKEWYENASHNSWDPQQQQQPADTGYKYKTPLMVANEFMDSDTKELNEPKSSQSSDAKFGKGFLSTSAKNNDSNPSNNSTTSSSPVPAENLPEFGSSLGSEYMSASSSFHPIISVSGIPSEPGESSDGQMKMECEMVTREVGDLIYKTAKKMAETELKPLRKKIADVERENARLQNELNQLKGKFERCRAVIIDSTTK